MRQPSRSTLCLVLIAALASASVEAQKKGKQSKASEKAAKEAAKILAAEYKKKGYKKVKGIWLAKEHTADAKKGIYHHDGERLNKYEILKIQSGFVRHPRTGEFISKGDLAQAKAGKFPVEGGNWVSEDEANKFHSDASRPWVVRSTHCTLISTLPLKTITFEIMSQADGAISRLLPVFGGATPPPDRRPMVYVLPGREAYIQFGEDHGGHGSSHGAFLTPEFTFTHDGCTQRVGAANWEANWGAYYVRHAAGIALSHSMCGKLSDDLPEWFHRGVAAWVELFIDDTNIKHFGAKFRATGVEGLAKWLEGYAIRSDMSVPKRYSHLFGAGLLFHFAMRGGDAKATAALQKLGAAFQSGKKIPAAVKAFGAAVAKAETEFMAYLKKVTD